MPISVIHELLTQESKPHDPINQETYSDLDSLAIPEFHRLYHPVPTISESCESTVPCEQEEQVWRS